MPKGVTIIADFVLLFRGVSGANLPLEEESYSNGDINNFHKS